METRKVDIGAKQLLAFDPDQMLDFMKKHQASGAIGLVVDGFAEMNEAETRELHERLLHPQKYIQAQANTEPPDPDKLNQRSPQLPSDEQGYETTSTSPTDAAGSPTDATGSSTDATGSSDDGSDQLTERRNIWDILQSETKHYYLLVGDGARPLYPIRKIEKVVNNPEKYRHLWQPFSRHPVATGPDWEVFQNQWRRQEDYRNWQLENRGIIVPENFDAHGFDSYVKRDKKSHKRTCRESGSAEIEANLDSLKKPQTLWQQLNQRERKRNRFGKPECAIFTEYHQALKTRIAAHGVQEEIMLLEDPQAQDPLTTWHEYLGFELWWQDEYARDYEKKQRYSDKIYARIEKLGFLEANDTPEILAGPEPLKRYRSEIEKWLLESQTLQTEVESACQKSDKWMLESQTIHTEVESDCQESDAEPDTYQEMKASSALDDANLKLAKLGERSRVLQLKLNELSAFHEAAGARDEAKALVDNQTFLIKWVLDQVPLIKAEMAAKTTKRGTPAISDTGTGCTTSSSSSPCQGKLRRLSTEETNAGMPSTQKRDTQPQSVDTEKRAGRMSKTSTDNSPCKDRKRRFIAAITGIDMPPTKRHCTQSRSVIPESKVGRGSNTGNDKSPCKGSTTADADTDTPLAQKSGDSIGTMAETGDSENLGRRKKLRGKAKADAGAASRPAHPLRRSPRIAALQAKKLAACKSSVS